MVTGIPWTLKNYSIEPSGSQCSAIIEFTCASCAGNCDAFVEVQLTVAAQ